MKTAAKQGVVIKIGTKKKGPTKKQGKKRTVDVELKDVALFVARRKKYNKKGKSPCPRFSRKI